MTILEMFAPSPNRGRTLRVVENHVVKQISATTWRTTIYVGQSYDSEIVRVNRIEELIDGYNTIHHEVTVEGRLIYKNICVLRAGHFAIQFCGGLVAD